MNTPFEITKDEVLQLAANKLVDAYNNEAELSDLADSILRKRIEEIIVKGIESRVDEFLRQEMETLLLKEIVPVDVWGEKAGTPTTLRAVLHQRAREFWDVKVDESGRKSDWGGVPRHERLMSQILKDEFSKAVKENAEVVVAEFKKAILADSTRIVTEHINRLIK